MHFIEVSPCPTVISKMGIRFGPQQRRPAHLANHARHLARLQLVQRPRIQPVLIPKRQMQQQVLDRRNPLFCQHFGDGRADAFHKLDGSFKREHCKRS